MKQHILTTAIIDDKVITLINRSGKCFKVTKASCRLLFYPPTFLQETGKQNQPNTMQYTIICRGINTKWFQKYRFRIDLINNSLVYPFIIGISKRKIIYKNKIELIDEYNEKLHNFPITDNNLNAAIGNLKRFDFPKIPSGEKQLAKFHITTAFLIGILV